jgi:hypothetical protein
MSRPVLDFDPGAVQRVPSGEPVDTRDAPGVLDQAAAAVRVQVDTVDDHQLLRRAEAYRPLIDALVERGVNPRDLQARPSLFGIDLGNGPPDFDKIWRLAKQAGLQGLPEQQEQFDRNAYTRQGERARDQETLARGGGIVGTVAQFTGGVIGSFADPVNAYSALIPVGATSSIWRNMLLDGAVNAGVELYQVKDRPQDYANLGEEYTLEQGIADVGFAFAGGAAIRGGIDVAPVAGRALNDNVIQPVRRMIDPNLPDKELARAFAEMVPQHLRTPEQDAALFIINRSEEIRAANPFVDTYDALDAHAGKLQTALDALEAGRVPGQVEIEAAGVSPVPAAPVRAGNGGGGFDREGVKAAIRGPESAGDDFAVNRAGSSAAGRYQFIESTFVRLYQREYGVSEAAAQRAWAGNRFDVNVQERLMDRLLDDNAAALARAGLPADAGNLYLAHFAGAGKAVELLRAPRDAPVSAFFSAQAIRQNPTYLGGGKTVGEAIETIRGKMGDPAERSPVPLAPDNPPLRDPALDAERPVSALVPPSRVPSGLPPELEPVALPLVDIVNTPGRSLNQFAALAEELGTDEVTIKAALQALVERGVLTQNSKTGTFMRKAAAPETIANTKRPRTLLEFLAERGGINDTGGDLRALGIRNSDRRMGRKIIRNARQDGGGVVSGEGVYGLDTAFRDAREAGYFPEFEGMAENGYDELLDEAGLLLAAIDQELAGAPRYRMDDWGRLAEYKLEGATEGEFGGLVRAADEAADDAPSINDQFRLDWADYGHAIEELPEGPLLDRAALLWANGRGLEPMHAVAQAAQDEYDELIALAVHAELAQEYTYYDPWNPQWDAEFDARFEAARARGRADGADGAGQPDDAGGAPAGQGDGASPADGRAELDSQGLNARERDEAIAARPRSDHTDLPPDPDPRFAEADSPAIVASAESAWHDIRQLTEADPNIAARQRQEAQLGAEAPLRAAAEQDGVMGTPLFDAIDQQKFDLATGAASARSPI